MVGSPTALGPTVKQCISSGWVWQKKFLSSWQVGGRERGVSRVPIFPSRECPLRSNFLPPDPTSQQCCRLTTKPLNIGLWEIFTQNRTPQVTINIKKEMLIFENLELQKKHFILKEKWFM